MKKNRRTTLFIEPSFQKSFLIFIAMLSIFVNLVYFFGNLAFFSHFRQMGTDMKLPEYHAFFRMIDIQQQQMLWVFVGTVALVTLICLGLGLYMSNRVAGPIYRMRRHLETVAEGGETPAALAFRKRDYFLDLAASYRKAHGSSKNAG